MPRAQPRAAEAGLPAASGTPTLAARPPPSSDSPRALRGRGRGRSATSTSPRQAPAPSCGGAAEQFAQRRHVTSRRTR